MNGLLVCAGDARKKNIGDYIQSIAQESFFDHVDCLVERERVNDFSSLEKVNLIMNAWWMWNPANFPPSSSINPLFVSFHLVPSVAEKMLRPEVVQYLKNYEPIGARDLGTQVLLESKGIRSYFSGCLTLTLGRKFRFQEKEDKILFVDPYFETGGRRHQKDLFRLFYCFVLLFKYRKIVKLLKKKFTYEYETFLSRLLRLTSLEHGIMCASFYDTYKNIFSDDVLLNAEYITHSVDQIDYPSDGEKLKYARFLVSKYAKAKLVVTSRIHCGLPCLGVETPVIFVTADALNGNSVRSSGRFGGLIDLFHVAKWTRRGVLPVSSELKSKTENKKIDSSFELANSNAYKKLRDGLEKTVCQWLKKKVV